MISVPRHWYMLSNLIETDICLYFVEKSNRSSPVSNINLERRNQSISAVSPTKVSEDIRRSPISAKLVSSGAHLNQPITEHTSPGKRRLKIHNFSSTLVVRLVSK